MTWQATLKADCATFPVNAGQSPHHNRQLIFLDNAVTFKLTDGEIAFSDSQNVRAYDDKDFVNIIMANSPNAHVILDGGTVSTTMRDTVAIKATQNGGTRVTLTSGTIDAPSAEVVQAKDGRFSLNEANPRNGQLIINGLVDGGGFGQATPYLKSS